MFNHYIKTLNNMENFFEDKIILSELQSINSFEEDPFKPNPFDYFYQNFPTYNINEPPNNDPTIKICIDNNDVIIKEDKKALFTIEKKDNKSRKRKREIGVEDEKSVKFHDKYSIDNIQKKVHGHFISFVQDYVNYILEQNGIEEKFFKIDYDFKRKISNKFISELKYSNIGEILNQDISPKFTKIKKENNKNVFESIKNKNCVKDLFSLNYYNLFKNVYYKDKRIINLKINGKKVNIFLPKNRIEMFGDLLKKNQKSNKLDKSDENRENDKYINALKKYVVENFLAEVAN